MTGIAAKVRDAKGTPRTSMAPIPFGEYRAIKAMNCSALKDFSRSPLHFWEKNLNPNREPEEPSPALRLGSAVHCYALEGLEQYEREFVVAPNVDRRFKVGKAAWAEFLAGIADRECTVLEEDEDRLVRRIGEAVLSHEIGGNLIRGFEGAAEETIQWIDEETGVACKGRLDRIVTIDGQPWIVDLKTTEDARSDEFAKSLARFSYHWQAAFYLDGVRASGCWGDPGGFLFVCVEKKPPHAVAIYSASEAAVHYGREGYRAALRRYLLCAETNEWPGYAPEVTEIDLPRWAIPNV